ncbi:hypothetical protein [Asanoa siamensis]|uniref:Uncharacterized protein n=1 Tax=Asanoa siamensis TaxID=926357 RepID=A0ABQ4CJR8_9ACTN|nr:hypothetical protein [Asanoa siamensis]GIF71537.1 hypothetical protein Asi02nite_10550 [Asanoa siamensis]
MDDGRPGRITGVVGTVVAAAGVVVVLTEFSRAFGDGRGIMVGGILVVAGLLLRVEGAIWASRGPAEDES